MGKERRKEQRSFVVKEDVEKKKIAEGRMTSEEKIERGSEDAGASSDGPFCSDVMFSGREEG